jgi:hydrogenase nickel incorporation protein HypB
MCTTCGCSNGDNSYKLYSADGKNHPHGGAHDHVHEHTHEHPHEHLHTHTAEQHAHRVEVETDILATNNMQAQRNRGYLEAKNVVAFNLMSSPGSGKTSLLERTLADLKDELTCYVIEGDQQTSNDADRIRATGTKAVQINTGNGCHLDAGMVNHAIKELQIADGSVVFIENVGNLVCPSLFDLGETKRVVIISVTEGDDKPLKYPTMFHSADICIIHKTDLLPYVKFDVDKAKENALRVNHHLRFFEISVYQGTGLDAWYDWLRGLSNHTNRV